MARLLELFEWIDPRKARAAVMVGLAAGVVVSSLFAHDENRASGKERAPAESTAQNTADAVPASPDVSPDVSRDAGTAGAKTGLSAAADTATAATPQTTVQPLAVEPPAAPADFLDATVEQLIRKEFAQKRARSSIALENGQQIEFSIIPELQAAVERDISSYKPDQAAFVAVDPRTGEVLALVGFADGRLTPHFALEADGPAASVFKIVTAAALIELKNVSIRKEVCFHGGHAGVSRSHLTPDPRADTECQSMSEAMGKSSNVVFARLAHNRLAPADLRTYAERFGFDRAIPFLWPVELSRLDVPGDRLEFARMAAGFYHANLSPFHAALLAAAIANDGLMMQPQIISSISSRDGDVIFRLKPRSMGRAVSPATAGKLTSMMLTTTTDGTAAKYFRKRSKALAGIDVAGKTGSLSRKVGEEQKHYSWFVGFAPADNPTIAFASVAVNGPKWKVKGPAVARRALDTYFGASQRAAGPGPRKGKPAARLPAASAL